MAPSLFQRIGLRASRLEREIQLSRIGRLQVEVKRTLLLFAALRGGSTWLERLVRTSKNRHDLGTAGRIPGATGARAWVQLAAAYPGGR